MLKVKLNEGESLDKALKRFKKKYEKTGILWELRERQAYMKPSRKKRDNLLKAIYRQKLFAQEN